MVNYIRKPLGSTNKVQTTCSCGDANCIYCKPLMGDMKTTDAERHTPGDFIQKG